MHLDSLIGDSPTLLLSTKAKTLAAEGKKIINLAIGEPDFKTPTHIIAATKKALDEGFTTYSTPQGLIELRSAISDKYNNAYTAAEVLVVPGAKAALFTSLAAILKPHDEVIILSPYYVSYPALIKLAEPTAKIITIPLEDNFSFPLEKIKAHLNSKTKCLIVNYPHNPTGQILKEMEINSIVQLVNDNSFYLLSDEIYELMMFNNSVHPTFAAFKAIKDKLIVINGFSKSYAMTGFRLGYVLSNAPLIKTMNQINQNIFTNTTTFSQYGALSALKEHPFHLLNYNKELDARAHYIHAAVTRLPLFTGFMPKSAFYYFLDISKTNMTSTDFANTLLTKYGLVVTPGIAFGTDFDHYVRLSLAVSIRTLKEAVVILEAFCKDK